MLDEILVLSSIIAGTASTIVGAAPGAWKQCSRNPSSGAKNIVDINIVAMVELGMISTMFLDCTVGFDPLFNLLVL